MTEEDLMRLLMSAAMFNTMKETPAKTENNSKVTDVLSVLNPLAIASLGEVLKELDFVVNCEIEGDVEKDRFEPHLKLSFRIGRSMENVLKMKEHELEQIDVLSQIENEKEMLKMGREFKLIEFQEKIARATEPFRVGNGVSVGTTSSSACGCEINGTPFGTEKDE